jgi:hypothetical protein
MNRFITRNGMKILQYYGMQVFSISEGNSIIITVEGWFDVDMGDEADQTPPGGLIILTPEEFGAKFADHPDYLAYLAMQP